MSMVVVKHLVKLQDQGFLKYLCCIVGDPLMDPKLFQTPFFLYLPVYQLQSLSYYGSNRFCKVVSLNINLFQLRMIITLTNTFLNQSCFQVPLEYSCHISLIQSIEIKLINDQCQKCSRSNINMYDRIFKTIKNVFFFFWVSFHVLEEMEEEVLICSIKAKVLKSLCTNACE